MAAYTRDLDKEISSDHLDQTYFIFCRCYRITRKLMNFPLHADSVDILSDAFC